MPSNINYQFPKTYDPNSWGQQLGARYNYGQESKTSFNKQYFDDFYTRRLSGGLYNMIKNNPRVGILSGPKVDFSDFGRYLGLLPMFATSYNLISEAITPGGKTLTLGSIPGSGDFGPSYDTVPANNGDGKKMYGQIANLQYNQQQRWRFQVTEEMITLTNTENGTPSGTRPEIPVDAEVLILPSNISFLGDLVNGCISCKRESCGNGYRTLLVHKNPYKAGTYGQGDYTGELITEVMFVLDTEVLDNGNVKLTVHRGRNGQTYTDPSTGLQYNPSSLPLEAGDFILVGAVAPSTECHPRDFGGCAVKRPKSFSFCEGVQEFSDCLLCIDKTQFATRQSDELLTREEQLVYNFIENSRSFIFRIYNEFLYGKNVYGANYPMPQHPTLPVGSQFNGELIPYKINGIIDQFDRRSHELEITFDSCDQQCWEYGLRTVVDALDAGARDNSLSTNVPYSAPGWMIVGDVKSLKELSESRKLNFAPMTLGDRVDQLNQFGETFSVKSSSLFRSANTVAQRNMINEFDGLLDSFNIEMFEMQIGKYTFKAIHDRYMEMTEPGVVRLMYIPDIMFFTDNQDEVMRNISNMLGISNSLFAPASASATKLIPSVISRDLIDTYVNGQTITMAKDDCPFNLYGYLRAGVFYSPRNISTNLKIRFNARIANPDATLPTDPATIKVPLDRLGCGCNAVHRDIVNGLDNWGQGPIITQPFNFATPTESYIDSLLQ